MSIIQDAPPNQRMSHFTPEDFRAWGWVLGGMRFMWATLFMALIVFCLCAPLSLIVDRSDQAFPLFIVGVGHVFLAIPQATGLILCCCAPAESETRRRARQVTWLILAAALLFLVIVAIGLAEFLRFLRPDPWSLGASRGLVRVGVGVSFLVNVALIGFAALRLHTALSRDLADATLMKRAQRVLIGWIAFWGFCAPLLVFHIFDAFFLRETGVPVGLRSLGLAAVALTVVEMCYLGLIGDSCRALRTSLSRMQGS